MRIIAALFLCISVSIAFPAYSAWQLNLKESSLTFVSIKKDTIAENHSFKKFSGEISDSGLASMTIDLDSVDTNIAIRDERMAEFLFETGTFAQASFSAQLSTLDIDGLAVGSSQLMSLKGNLNLHGHKQELMMQVFVAKLSEKNMLISTLQPLIIKAEDFALVAGINKLKSLANLPNIAYAVPVSFTLTFTQ